VSEEGPFRVNNSLRSAELAFRLTRKAQVGITWHPRPNLVVRAGAGIFYDLGYSDVADGINAFPYV